MEGYMQPRCRVFLRPSGVCYREDLLNGDQGALKTREQGEAFRLVAAKNETQDGPAFSRQLARVYWKAGDPAAATRTWQSVMDELVKLKHGSNQHRWEVAMEDKAFDPLRQLPVLETRPEHFVRVLQAGTVS